MIGELGPSGSWIGVQAFVQRLDLGSSGLIKKGSGGSRHIGSGVGKRLEIPPVRVRRRGRSSRRASAPLGPTAPNQQAVVRSSTRCLLSPRVSSVDLDLRALGGLEEFHHDAGASLEDLVFPDFGRDAFSRPPGVLGTPAAADVDVDRLAVSAVQSDGGSADQGVLMGQISSADQMFRILGPSLSVCVGCSPFTVYRRRFRARRPAGRSRVDRRPRR